MVIRLADKCTIDSIVDGPGLRIVVWTQGCPHHCPFCHNPQTHDYNGGFLSDTDEIIKLIDNAQLQQGITFSGGEPFEQPLPLIEIAKAAKKKSLNIWAYTGYLYEELLEKKDCLELLKYIDVLVDGEFVNDLKDYRLIFKGSLNQRIIDVQSSLKKKQIVISNFDKENILIKE